MPGAASMIGMVLCASEWTRDDLEDGRDHLSENRKAAIAAALILIGFGVVAYLMPRIMLAIGEYSPWAAGTFAALFVLAFFGVFWLRARAQKKKRD